MLTWITNEPTGIQEYLRFMARCLLLAFTWLGMSMIILISWDKNSLGHSRILYDSELFTFVVVIAPLIEEVEHRFFPLLIGRLIDKMWTGFPLMTILFLLATTYRFGMDHVGYGFFFVQGVLGLICGIVFLKCGGMRGRWGYVKGYASCAIVHMSWNLFSLVFEEFLFISQL